MLADFEEFVTLHRAHGLLCPDIGEPTPNGYRIILPCSCGVTFERWVSPEQAQGDLTVLARLN